jgi:hypothetical protein
MLTFVPGIPGWSTCLLRDRDSNSDSQLQRLLSCRLDDPEMKKRRRPRNRTETRGFLRTSALPLALAALGCHDIHEDHHGEVDDRADKDSCCRRDQLIRDPPGT